MEQAKQIIKGLKLALEEQGLHVKSIEVHNFGGDLGLCVKGHYNSGVVLSGQELVKTYPNCLFFPIQIGAPDCIDRLLEFFEFCTKYAGCGECPKIIP